MDKFTSVEKQIEMYKRYLNKNGISEVYAYELGIVWELELQERISEGFYGSYHENNFREEEYTKDSQKACSLEKLFWEKIRKLNEDLKSNL